MKVNNKKLCIFVAAVGVLIAAFCLYIIYSRSGMRLDYFHGMALGCILGGCVLVAVTGYLVLIRKTPLRVLYPLLGITLGIITYFVLPVYTKPDDTHHGAAAYALSNQLLGTTMEGAPQERLRRSCDNLLDSIVDGDAGERQMLYLSQDTYNMIGSWFAPTDETDIVKAEITKYKGGNPVPYLPGALGITLARLMGLNFGWAALFAALLQILFFTAVMTWAIHKTPIGKNLFLVFGLLPIVLQQVASFSYDCALLAGCVIVTALCFYWAYDPGRKWLVSDFLMYALAALLLAFTKGGVYAPLLILPLLLLVRKDMLKKPGTWLILLGVLLVIGIGLTYWLFRMGGLETIKYQMDYEYYNIFVYESGHSITYYLQHPQVFLTRFFHTLRTQTVIYLKELVGGFLGWRRTIVISWKLLLVFYGLLLLAMMEVREHQKRIPLLHRILFLVIFGGYAVFMLLLMAVRWSAASWDWIDGVQGRYFLPTFLLALAGLGFWSGERAKKIGGKIPGEIFPIAMAALDYLVLCGCVWMSTIFPA